MDFGLGQWIFGSTDPDRPVGLRGDFLMLRVYLGNDIFSVSCTRKLSNNFPCLFLENIECLCKDIERYLCFKEIKTVNYILVHSISVCVCSINLFIAHKLYHIHVTYHDHLVPKIHFYLSQLNNRFYNTYCLFLDLNNRCFSYLLVHFHT